MVNSWCPSQVSYLVEYNDKNELRSTILPAEISTSPERFSNPKQLILALKTIEQQYVSAGDTSPRSLAMDRSAVVEATEGFRVSPDRLGEALEKYRTHFKEEGAWMEIAEAIGRAMRKNERTVRNIVADYQRIKPLPEKIIEASQSLGIELSQKKYSPAVAILKTETTAAMRLTEATAKEMVMKAVQSSSEKSDKLKKKQELSKEEKEHFKIRMKIRTSLNNIPNPQKLAKLIEALEEEMHDVWGVSNPVSITITGKIQRLTPTRLLCGKHGAWGTPLEC